LLTKAICLADQAIIALKSVNWQDRNTAAIHIRRLANTVDKAHCQELLPTLLHALSAETKDQAKKNLLACVATLGDESCIPVVQRFFSEEEDGRVKEAALEAIEILGKSTSFDSSTTDLTELSPVEVKAILKQTAEEAKKKRSTIKSSPPKLSPPEVSIVGDQNTLNMMDDDFFEDPMVLESLDRSIQSHKESLLSGKPRPPLSTSLMPNYAPGSGFTTASALKNKSEAVAEPVAVGGGESLSPRKISFSPSTTNTHKRKERPPMLAGSYSTPIVLACDDTLAPPPKRQKIAEFSEANPPLTLTKAHPNPITPHPAPQVAPDVAAVVCKQSAALDWAYFYHLLAR